VVDTTQRGLCITSRQLPNRSGWPVPVSRFVRDRAGILTLVATAASPALNRIVSTLDTILLVPNESDPLSDELWMQEALRSAQRALDEGEVPVGAVVIHQGRVIGRGFNRNMTDSDPTAHAEIVALREAGKALGNHRLLNADLYVTIEPCAMCAGAISHARLRSLVYGTDDPKAGAVHSVMCVLNHPALNHKVEVRAGVLAGRCAELLQEFFRVRRA